MSVPEVRFTRISGNYDTVEEEVLPPKPTKAEKKAAKKLAAQQKKEMEMQIIMRHALKTELEIGKRMELRGMEEWNKIASEIKVVELRKDMLDWGERAEVIIAHKNDRIKMLLDDMEQTQEHHSRSFNKVIELIDHIIECYHAMLESSKRMYDEQAEEVLKEFYDELRFRTEEVDAMHLNSENIIHASNLVARDTLKLDYNIYLEQRDHYVNKDIEARFQIRDSVVRRMSEMQRQLNEFVDSLFNTELDAHKYERIRSLTERQQNFFDETRKLDVEEMKYMGILNDLQRDILRVEAENNTTINDLKLEFEYFANVRKKIEERMHADRITTHEKLRILSTECYQLTKKFEKIVKSGELLLALSITCRKLQTESEKIIVGGEVVDPVDVGPTKDDFTIQTLDLYKHVDIEEDQLVSLNKNMINFWRKQAMAQAQNMLLLEEKNRLTEENQRYIDFIKSMSKTEDAEELRTAMVVSSCTQPIPFLFDTPCRGQKVKVKKESIYAGIQGRRQAANVIKTVVMNDRAKKGLAFF